MNTYMIVHHDLQSEETLVTYTSGDNMRSAFIEHLKRFDQRLGGEFKNLDTTPEEFFNNLELSSNYFSGRIWCLSDDYAHGGICNEWIVHQLMGDNVEADETISQSGVQM